METKQGHMHIGAQIQKRVKELGLTNSQFANLINCHRTNVNNIYKSETLDTLKLQRISEVLRFDFFQYYVSDYSSSSADEVISKRIEFSSEEMAKIAKNKISNQYVQPYAIYQEDMRIEYEQKNRALLNLEKALEQEEFVVCYQPVVEGKTGQIVSAEALVRWNSSGEGPMIPSVFVPELEDSGYITKLDTYIDQTVRRFQEERYRKGKRMIPVAVNLSRMDLMNSRLMERICTELQETKVPKQYFRYEIIESAYTIIDKQGEEFLESLRREGVQIFLDDFGTGISTFETVRDYTFDALKIDMGFVKKIGKNPKSDAIVISIIDMAHRMGMKVVAEGIENKQQSEFLCNHGCDYLQGYYYYKPMSAEEFSKLLDK